VLLAVDVGNTQTVLGLYEGECLLAHWRVATVATDTADELDVRIRSLFALKGLESAIVTNVAIASVVPPLTEQWRLVGSRYTADEPLVLHSGLDVGLPIHYSNPAEIGADRLAESFWRSFGTPVTIIRPFNTYGPRQSARAIIPTIITQLFGMDEESKKEIHLGSLQPTRDFNYAKDTVAGFLAIESSDKTIGEEINISSGTEISIGDLALELIRQLRPDVSIVCDEERKRPVKSEVERLLGSNEKIKRLTGWAPKYDLTKGLAETIEWYRKNKGAFDASRYYV
jgi:hypothetical protein